MRFRLFGKFVTLFPDKRGLRCSEFAFIFLGLFSDLEFDGVSPFWPPKLLPSEVCLPFSLIVTFSIGIVGLSTYSLGYRRNFALLAEGFIVEFPILVARSGVLPLLLRKTLAIVGCVVVIVFLLVVVDDVIIVV